MSTEPRLEREGAFNEAAAENEESGETGVPDQIDREVGEGSSKKREKSDRRDSNSGKWGSRFELTFGPVHD
ncbi:hypothetical protein [Paenibacillus sp. OAE614]|uniref:hypothetical protein n=1 Tax=Paenibacillus sp. OAE614 TaxID=2663804 RepID=UPI00178BBA80